jgi:hypothetical protein
MKRLTLILLALALTASIAASGASAKRMHSLKGGTSHVFVHSANGRFVHSASRGARYQIDRRAYRGLI